jgi:Fe-S cluster assembly protein SufD
VTTTLQNTGTYLDAFADFSRKAAGHDVAWLRRLREDAFARFSETGFPTTHDEDWRFTNVSSIARQEFSLARGTTSVSDSDFRGWILDGAAARLVFVDGQFAPTLSDVRSLPTGVKVSSLKKEIARAPEVLRQHLGQYLDIRRDPFCALNTAFAEEGAFVHIAAGTVIDRPIHLLFLSTAGNIPNMVHPRNLLLIEREAQAQIIEEYGSLGSGMVLSNSATELVAGENSTVSHSMIERENLTSFNISTLRVQMDRNANFASHSVLLGGGLVRNNVHPVLAGEGGECLINGLFAGNGQQHLDNYMYVEHASPHSTSRQFYNGILDGAAHGVFHGRIVVHKNAQKTDAKQTNRNLLLSDDAQIDTKPQLEIYADDVKCTHGATIGQIEENALFYLRSRGIDEVSARRLLLGAFANECVERMNPGPARTHVEELIASHLLSMAHPSGHSSIANRETSSIDSKDKDTERRYEEVG